MVIFENQIFNTILIYTIEGFLTCLFILAWLLILALIVMLIVMVIIRVIYFVDKIKEFIKSKRKHKPLIEVEQII